MTRGMAWKLHLREHSPSREAVWGVGLTGFTPVKFGGSQTPSDTPAGHLLALQRLLPWKGWRRGQEGAGELDF